MRILGLDPGESTGYAVIDVEGERLEVVSYGVVAVTAPGREGLVQSIAEFCTADTSDSGAFSEIVQMPKVPTSHKALEVQGVVRMFGFTGYNPSTVHSQLGTRKKADTRALVGRILGFQIRGDSGDHIRDAFAAAFCHALKLGVWQPRIDLRATPAHERPQRGPGKRKIDVSTPEGIRDAMNRGDIKVAPR